MAGARDRHSCQGQRQGHRSQGWCGAARRYSPWDSRRQIATGRRFRAIRLRAPRERQVELQADGAWRFEGRFRVCGRPEGRAVPTGRSHEPRA
jgi:hypothetical protein